MIGDGKVRVTLAIASKPLDKEPSQPTEAEKYAFLVNSRDMLQISGLRGDTGTELGPILLLEEAADRIRTRA